MKECMWTPGQHLLLITLPLLALTPTVWATTSDGSLGAFSFYLFRISVAGMILGVIVMLGPGSAPG